MLITKSITEDICEALKRRTRNTVLTYRARGPVGGWAVARRRPRCAWPSSLASLAIGKTLDACWLEIWRMEQPMAGQGVRAAHEP